jgi:hypothetical protein
MRLEPLTCDSGMGGGVVMVQRAVSAERARAHVDGRSPMLDVDVVVFRPDAAEGHNHKYVKWTSDEHQQLVLILPTPSDCL